MDPEGDVLDLVASHFSDRFPLENWMIYDHPKKEDGGAPLRKDLVRGGRSRRENHFRIKGIRGGSRIFRSLEMHFLRPLPLRHWKNAKLQNQLAPLKYRAYMTEYKNNKGLHFCKK